MRSARRSLRPRPAARRRAATFRPPSLSAEVCGWNGCSITQLALEIGGAALDAGETDPVGRVPAATAQAQAWEQESATAAPATAAPATAALATAALAKGWVSEESASGESV